MKPLENSMVIGDYYPAPPKPEPDPDEIRDRLLYGDGTPPPDNFYPRSVAGLIAGLKCPHNCPGCTCRNDPRQLKLPFSTTT